MEKGILLTIFVVTYNRANYLRACIKSILEQSYQNFQLVILDNASIDDTQNIVNSFKDNRIGYIRHEKNIGGCNNIKYAFNLCETKYFIVFHDDDIMNNDLLKKEIGVLEENEKYAIVSSLATFIDGEGKRIASYNTKRESGISIFKGNEYIRNFLLKRQGIICPSVMFRNAFFKEKALTFRTDVGQAADQYLWFEAAKNGGILCRINERLMKYRVHEDQDSLIHSDIMEVDLLDAVIKNNICNIKNNQLTLVIEEYIKTHISAINIKFINKEISESIYCDAMDKLIKHICKTKKRLFLLKTTKLILIKFPLIVRIIYKITSHLKKLINKIVN